MKVVGVVQARMGSTRLPGKVLMPLAGVPVVEHVSRRIEAIERIDQIVLATTTDERNDPLEAWATGMGYRCIRHDIEDDIAGRMAAVFAATDAEAMLKCNGDCPLADSDLMRAMVDAFLEIDGCDYLSNKVRFTYPLGVSAEVLGRAAIDWCDRSLTDPAERELVCDYIRDHTDRFTVAGMTQEIDQSRLGLMLDEERDYTELQNLFAALESNGRPSGLNDVLLHLGEAPAMLEGKIELVGDR